MPDRLRIHDFLRAAMLCVAICLTLLAIKFSIFGWVGAAASIFLVATLFCLSRRRLRWRLLVPAIILAGIGYTATSATVASVIL